MKEIKLLRNDRGITWGYGMPWYEQFMSLDKDDRLIAKLKFLKKYGFKTTNFMFGEIVSVSQERLDKIAQYIHDNDLSVNIHVSFDYVHSTEDEIKAHNDKAIKELYRLTPLLRSEITHTGANAGHRFDDEMPVEEKMQRLSKGLAPVAVECAKMGAHLCIENHADFYVSDYIELIKSTPNLYLFLDTGNTYFIGEKPLPAFIEAAPYTIGVHFKDHKVRPVYDARPIHFEIDGSPLGYGHVPLRECYKIMLQNRPMLDKLVIQFEMIVPYGSNDPINCLEKSIEFVNSL
ncbi:sugar phosphate isomerase/epimerase [Caldicoprobacter algeriensis]|uniref:sugar phosphate isomerase/epimerase family protein n=1 Tax=Caldicoprobacter algeriensis TaxID=699281 RepID=UPI0020792099|nr:TIM barrel protein [Caldicoprobacter algeriensis]MCM8900080.1 sugar phosphate isomerase/epimerase [Caldicoprobacter algeriensis]